jgi:type IV secretory pathway protease TraF
MRPRFDGRACRRVAALAACFAAPVAIFYAAGLRINFTPSHVPAGIWRARPADKLQTGDVIAYDKDEFYAAVPEAAEERMKFAAPRVIKKIAALPGAFVERSGDAVAIDGVLYPEARIADETWRKVDYPLVVPEGTVWLMADAFNSYDSRYHGPRPSRLVKEKLSPVWIWE